jgi:hypothetical protein
MSDKTEHYILFCSQDAGFQTRSMLIPYDLLMSCEERRKDIETMRKYSIKTDDIDNLLIQNITYEGDIGYYDKTPISEIIHEFKEYADGFDGIFKSYDEKWVKEIIPRVASNGFNHTNNYCNFRHRKVYKRKKINIVDGFLVLETSNGKFEDIPFDTVEEMMESLY